MSRFLFEVVVRPFLPAFVVAMSVACAPNALWAGARPPEAPAAQTVAIAPLAPMNNDQMRRKLLDACMLIMSAKDEPIKSAASSRCGCYSNGIMKDMSAPELDTLRTTGSFPAEARPRASARLATCNLPAS